MRFERLDWFWFTIIHELGHVRNKDGQHAGVVDVALVGQDASRGTTEKTEMAANEFAGDFLVPRRDLADFIARVGPLYSRERIRLFAKRLGIHPALVVGQLQFRGHLEYYFGRDMLKDKVRSVVTANALTDGWGHFVGAI
jgi:HTH-type transcriptional regulator/antitoxin HigA